MKCELLSFAQTSYLVVAIFATDFIVAFALHVYRSWKADRQEHSPNTTET